MPATRYTTPKSITARNHRRRPDVFISTLSRRHLLCPFFLCLSTQEHPRPPQQSTNELGSSASTTTTELAPWRTHRQQGNYRMLQVRKFPEKASCRPDHTGTATVPVLFSPRSCRCLPVGCQTIQHEHQGTSLSGISNPGRKPGFCPGPELELRASRPAASECPWQIQRAIRS